MSWEAYDDWARLEKESGESLVTVVGGLDLFPPDCVIAPDDYVAAMREVGIDFESLTAEEIAARTRLHDEKRTCGSKPARTMPAVARVEPVA